MSDVQHSWNQYALVAELAARMKGRPFGRTALQKITYLLQETHKVETGYEFPLYTYGPYSSELSSDLDTLAAMQGVQVVPDHRQGGYLISPGDRSASIRALGADFVRAHSEAIDGVIADFGGMSAKELELRATLVFADRDARRRRERLGREALVDVVHEIKPHFSKEQIEAALGELRARGYIAE
jgi:uncharacterized protein